MSISKKIFLIVALLVFPIVILAYVFTTESDKNIAFTQKELTGSTYLRALMPVYIGIFDNAVGAARLPAATELTQVNDALGDELNARDNAKSLISKLGGATRADDTLLGDASALVTRIGNESNLILDPDLDSYYAMDVVLLKIPEVIHQIQLYHQTLNALSDGISEEENEAVITHKGLLSGVVDGTFTSLDSVIEYDSGNNQKAELAPQSQAFRVAADKYLKAADAVVAAARKDPASSAGLLAPLAASRDDFVKASSALWTKTDERLDVIMQRRIDKLAATYWELMGISAAITVLALCLAVFLALGINRLIHRSVSEMLQLANGDVATRISGVERRDEIGSIAKALEVFRGNLIRAREFDEQQKASEARKAAEARQARAQIATSFQSAVGGYIKELTRNAQDLQGYAVTMRSAAEETTSQALTVSAASEEASAAVEAVASATEELNTSVNDIAEQIGRSSERAQIAVKTSGDTVAKVSTLREASTKIGAIVDLIKEIAEQTNLLALNATIEAARAGEAGRGFAVVAAEVKGLAAQTAKATEEISLQIASIQAATTVSVESIDDIAKQIRDLDTIIGSIAASVEQQAAATQEMSSSIQSASHGTVAVSANIAVVSGTAERSSQVAVQVLDSSAAQLRQSNHLDKEVSSFIASLTAA